MAFGNGNGKCPLVFVLQSVFSQETFNVVPVVFYLFYGVMMNFFAGTVYMPFVRSVTLIPLLEKVNIRFMINGAQSIEYN